MRHGSFHEFIDQATKYFIKIHGVAPMARLIEPSSYTQHTRTDLAVIVVPGTSHLLSSIINCFSSFGSTHSPILLIYRDRHHDNFPASSSLPPSAPQLPRLLQLLHFGCPCRSASMPARHVKNTRTLFSRRINQHAY